MKKYLIISASVIAVIMVLGGWLYYQRKSVGGEIMSLKPQNVSPPVSDTKVSEASKHDLQKKTPSPVKTTQEEIIKVEVLPLDPSKVASEEVSSDKNPDQEFYDNLKTLSSAELIKHWQDAIGTIGLPDSRYDLVKSALAAVLQHSDERDPTYNALRKLAMNSTDINEKVLLAELLRETATPPALDILLEWSKQSNSNDINNRIYGAIAEIGKNMWDGRFHPELSPVLEKEWKNIGNSDSYRMSAVSIGIASIGSDDGVELLMQSIESGSDTAAGKSAKAAVKELRNSDAISVLEKYLALNDSAHPAFLASGDALSSMGDGDATTVLLKWTQNADNNQIGLAKNWLKQIRDTESLEIAKRFLPGAKFKSPEMKDALLSVVNKIDESLKVETVQPAK